MRMQGYWDVYKWTILKRTSLEVKYLHPTSPMCTSSISNVIYHKFLHGAAFYMLNGKNVNIMLEYPIIILENSRSIINIYYLDGNQSLLFVSLFITSSFHIVKKEMKTCYFVCIPFVLSCL